jgi:hypothetical protein
MIIHTHSDVEVSFRIHYPDRVTGSCTIDSTLFMIRPIATVFEITSQVNNFPLQSDSLAFWLTEASLSAQ